MGQVAFNSYVALAETECCSCGITFAIPSNMLNKLRENKQQFYCPNGHALSYTESANDKLKKELEREKQRREIAERGQKLEAERAEKAEALANRRKQDHDRTKLRIKNGVCPCCNRAFANLANHMKTKHPTFIEAVSPSK